MVTLVLTVSGVIFVVVGVPCILLARRLCLWEQSVFRKLGLGRPGKGIRRVDVLITCLIGVVATGAGVLILLQTHFQVIFPYNDTYIDYRCRTRLILPFDGTWTIVAGGRNPIENHHARHGSQRYAYDFLVIGPNGRSYVGDGKRNEDYYAFGMPILAPGDGKVIQVVSGVPDNAPGTMNWYIAPGNMVVIEHDNGEYSMLAHLRYGATRVKVGDNISAGDRVGECGNSGNSGEPHLHYQLQNRPDLITADGLPPTFVNYTSNGKGPTRGTPETGERVSNNRMNAAGQAWKAD